MKRILLFWIALVPLLGNASALSEEKCVEIPPALRAAIESGSNYYDVWLQAPRATPTYKFGFEGWVVSADYAGSNGSDYEGNTDAGYWFVTSLDVNSAQIMTIDEGHSEYLSSFPNSKDFGYDFRILDNDFGQPLECLENAAPQTGAIGIDEETWIERHGSTVDTADGFTSPDGEFKFYTTDDRVYGIVWTPQVPMYPIEVRPLTRDLIPDDAHLAGPSEAPPTNIAQSDTYQSDWLSGRFEDDSVWGTEEPGSFATHYKLDANGLVTQVMIHTGWVAPTVVENQSSLDQMQSTGPSVVAADYTIFTEELIDTPNQRTRWVMRITMDPLSGSEALIEGIAQAVRDGMANHPEATCIVVFANSFDSESDADIGRGFFSVDGLGLSGEGDGLIGPDNGQIQVELLGLQELFYFTP